VIAGRELEEELTGGLMVEGGEIAAGGEAGGLEVDLEALDLGLEVMEFALRGALEVKEERGGADGSLEGLERCLTEGGAQAAGLERGALEGLEARLRAFEEALLVFELALQGLLLCGEVGGGGRARGEEGAAGEAQDGAITGGVGAQAPQEEARGDRGDSERELAAGEIVREEDAARHGGAACVDGDVLEGVLTAQWGRGCGHAAPHERVVSVRRCDMERIAQSARQRQRVAACVQRRAEVGGEGVDVGQTGKNSRCVLGLGLDLFGGKPYARLRA
jgi:hypothetical protein